MKRIKDIKNLHNKLFNDTKENLSEEHMIGNIETYFRHFDFDFDNIDDIINSPLSEALVHNNVLANQETLDIPF